jgi:hypothetical protein
MQICMQNEWTTSSSRSSYSLRRTWHCMPTLAVLDLWTTTLMQAFVGLETRLADLMTRSGQISRGPQVFKDMKSWYYEVYM